MRAIRDAESRTRFLGYRVESYKLWVFVFSAVDRRRRRRAVRAAGRHHQPERVRADQLDRSRDLGGGRRTRHALRRGGRRRAGELRQDVLHRRVAGSLALRARRAVRAGHAVSAARPRGLLAVTRERRNERSRQDALSREADRQLRRLQGAGRADAVRRSRRAALHHRPERRRQDDDDGRHHRQDAARLRHRVVRPRHRSADADRAGDRAGRHRPEVPEADRVRAADGVREPRARAGRRQVVLEDAASRA